MLKHLILLKYDGYQCGINSMVYKIFDKKTSKGTGVTSENTHPLHLATQQLAKELHKAIIKAFEK